jgi:amidohydrolase
MSAGLSPLVLLGGVALASFGQQEPAIGELLARASERVSADAADAIALRRDLHRHPEVSGSEVRTARVVAERLEALGLEVRTEVGGHGVVALLRGARPGPLVAYRADMDAVPSADPDPVEFASETPGVRHACGHDLHTAIGVALASALASVRDELPGSVLFVFQPAEEGATGARAVLADGAFAPERPVAVYGLHTSPYEVGRIGTRPGVLLASRDGLRITASGSGDLGAALGAAGEVATKLSTISAKDAFRPMPEGFVQVQLDPARPVPGGLAVEGTVTVAGEAARERVVAALDAGLRAIAVPGVELSHEHAAKLVPGVTNDPELTARATARLVALLGPEAVPTVEGILPAFSEDFGAFQDEAPGVFFFLGVSNAAEGIVGMPHTPGYVADEGALAFGTRAMAAVLLDRLSRG